MSLAALPPLANQRLEGVVLQVARRLLSEQLQSGAIPWFDAGPWDPWNHTECAMALAVAGERAAAERAYDYLVASQKEDGSWLADYGNALPMKDRMTLSREPAPQAHDTNFAAYCAVGVLHQTLCFEDVAFARRCWPMVSRALSFVLSLQTASGSIPWAAEVAHDPDEQPLLAGNASIFKSLECGIRLGRLLGEEVQALERGRDRLGKAVADLAGRQGQMGERFAMDWYYPVLSGALSKQESLERLDASWDAFVEPGLGCLCVEHEPWVTVAESCELVLTLLSVGRRDEAQRLLHQQLRWRAEDGSFWMGWQFEEALFWPAERPSWTQAAAVLALDALKSLSPAHDLLITHQGVTDGAAPAGC